MIIKGMRFTGVEQLRRKLQDLPRRGAIRAQRKAANAGIKVIAKSIRREVPRRTGLTKLAETSKVSNRGMIVWAGAGADVAKLKQQHAERGNRPTNIDWLIEFGHVEPDGTFVPPNAFMRRAAADMSQAEAAYVAKLGSEIEKEAMKA